jgi:ferredoxin
MRQRNWGSHRRRADRRAILRVTVDNQRCHLYGLCVLAAPDLFDLAPDARLQYTRQVPVTESDQAMAAARGCPMRAIQLTGGPIP